MINNSRVLSVEDPIIFRVTENNKHLFKISEQNRELNTAHKNRLKKSFIDLKTIIEYPVCDKYGTIVEGAHRYQAFLDLGFEKAEELGLKFYIVCNPDAKESQIGTVNAFNKKWTLDDYYKHNGYEDILIFKHNGINSQTICKILNIKGNDLKEGAVNLTQCDRYEELKKFNEFFESINSTLSEKIGKSNSRGNRFYALISFYLWNTKKINIERLRSIMISEGSFTNINSFSNINECAKKFVEIYNKSLLKNKRICFNENDFTFKI